MHKSTIMRLLISTGLFIFGGLITLGGIYSIVTKPADNPIVGSVVLVFIFGIVPLAFSILLLLRKRRKTPRGLVNQQALLQYAVSKKGRVTVTEVSLKFHLTLDQAKSVLEDLVECGIINVRIAKKGVLVYEFVGILDEDDKNNSCGIDE